MKILLDTHVFIWSATVDKLSQAATEAFLDTKNELYLSVASYWEMAIKISLGKLTLDENWIQRVDDMMSKNQLRWLAIDKAHCQVITTLPHLHGDPFDRLLIAQALVEEMTLMTADAKIRQYTVPILW